MSNTVVHFARPVACTISTQSVGRTHYGNNYWSLKVFLEIQKSVVHATLTFTGT